MLEFLCRKTLLGEASQVKEYTIAVELYGRSSDFGEKNDDSVVRVEAHRLRKKLTRFYDGAGRDHELRIVIRLGQYVPEFLRTARSLPDGVPTFKLPVAASQPLPAVPQPRPERLRLHISRFHLYILLAIAAGAILAASPWIATPGIWMPWIWQNLSPAGQPSRPARPSANPATPLLAGAVRELRLLAGWSGAPYAGILGDTWQADKYFRGGGPGAGPRQIAGLTSDTGLFRSMRSGEFSYDIPVAPGVYELRLYFADPAYRDGLNRRDDGENQRRFNITLNGRTLLKDFDVVSDSGSAAVDIRAFKDIWPASDGYVHLRFSGQFGAPFVNALQLLPTTAGRMRPVRFRAHELWFTDRRGRTWSPDDYFLAGRMVTAGKEVTGTPDPELFRGERYGNFSYSVPVPPGTYGLTLYFAETWSRPNSKGEKPGGIGTRVFDVLCNGIILLRNFDVVREAGGPLRAVTKSFHGLHPNGQGKLLIAFSPVTNYASVTAVEVTDETE